MRGRHARVRQRKGKRGRRCDDDVEPTARHMNECVILAGTCLRETSEAHRPNGPYEYSCEREALATSWAGPDWWIRSPRPVDRAASTWRSMAWCGTLSREESPLEESTGIRRPQMSRPSEQRCDARAPRRPRRRGVAGSHIGLAAARRGRTGATSERRDVHHGRAGRDDCETRSECTSANDWCFREQRRALAQRHQAAVGRTTGLAL